MKLYSSHWNMSLLQFGPTEHPCLQNHATTCLKKMSEFLISWRKPVPMGGWMCCTVRKPLCQYTTQIKHARLKDEKNQPTKENHVDCLHLTKLWVGKALSSFLKKFISCCVWIFYGVTQFDVFLAGDLQ